MSVTPQRLQRKDLIRSKIQNSIKATIIKFLCSSPVSVILSLVFQDKIPHRNSRRIDTQSARIAGETKSAIFFDIYERAEIDQMQAYCDFSLPVIELGASIGVCTLQILSNEAVKCIAIEPDPELFDILEANISLNFGDKHSCILLNCAIDYSGREDIAFESGVDSLSGQVKENQHHNDSINNVPTATLSGILDSHSITKYNLVIDIEGAETGLILEDDQALQKCYRIMGEFDGGTHRGRHYSIEALIAQLKEKGFRMLHSHGNRYTLQNSHFYSLQAEEG